MRGVFILLGLLGCASNALAQDAQNCPIERAVCVSVPTTEGDNTSSR